MTLLFRVGLLFCLTARVVYGWNDTGHEIIALLAYDRFTTAEKERIAQLLSNHPQSEAMLEAEKPATTNVREWTFLRAATWPDRIRSHYGVHQKSKEITKYDHPSWHYDDLPYVWPSDKAEFAGRTLPVPTGAIEAWAKLDSTMNDRTASEADKAIALCWIIHLAGDIHQPLHAAEMFSHETRRGDGGGNDLAVRTGNEIKNLHAVWDGMLGKTSSHDKIVQGTREIESEFLNDKSLRKLPELREHRTFTSWAEESHALAIRDAYLAGQLKFVTFHGYAQLKLPRESVPELDRDYITNGEKVARRQAALAGVRLAEEVKKVLASP